MGDMSEYKGLITAGTLLACFAILSMAIPISLYAAEEGRILEPPDYFDIHDIYHYTQTLVLNTTRSGGADYDTVLFPEHYIKEVDLGDWEADWAFRWPNSSYPYIMRIIHRHREWIIWGADHRLEWFNENGVSRNGVLEIAELNADLEGGNTADYRASCDHFTYYLQIAFNSTLYSDASDAWDNGGLGLFFGVQFDDMNTGFNAMNLIASILFFQMPDVHITINLLLAIPMWIAIGYISLILILRAIDALPFT